jgi:hypothetical protein
MSESESRNTSDVAFRYFYLNIIPDRIIEHLTPM